MAVIGFDLGGTKLSGALFDRKGHILFKTNHLLEKRQGKAVASLIHIQWEALSAYAQNNTIPIQAVGMSVPGISYPNTGKVWVPNIPGWTDYPLYQELTEMVNDTSIRIHIDNDRACSLLGELWMGKAKGCKDVIFLAVGTGIGAGILANGQIISGAAGAAGAIGWMALDRPFMPKYEGCGCFEYHASGEGIAKVAREFLKNADDAYQGVLQQLPPEKVTAHDVFEAGKKGDTIAQKVLSEAIAYWGMTLANLISLFNPEKIILGGGVFGSALDYLPDIMEEAKKWAQPVSIQQVTLEAAALGPDAALFGAGYLTLHNTPQKSSPDAL